MQLFRLLLVVYSCHAVPWQQHWQAELARGQKLVEPHGKPVPAEDIDDPYVEIPRDFVPHHEDDDEIDIEEEPMYDEHEPVEADFDYLNDRPPELDGKDKTVETPLAWGDPRNKVERSIISLARQMMLQQLYVEERTRSEGDSGLKQIRHNYEGTRPYYAPHHSGSSAAAIHDHANNIRTVGLGEFVAVLNGVEFRTRHNDYQLRMPSRYDTKYGKLEPIPFPDVPPAVENKESINEEIQEMREWFRAFKTQNLTHRDYRPYFKPILCYLEGAWTKTTAKIDESFPSDRHWLESRTWFELQQKIKFTSYTGRKNRNENYAFLPTTVIGVSDRFEPVFGQWNYRIACHPLRNHLPLNKIRVVDDLALRFSGKQRLHQMANTRRARFQLHDFWRKKERYTGHTLIDRLMGEVPGKDNYPGVYFDDAFDMMAMDVRFSNHTPLNAAYYHRWYKVARPGAMGLQRRHRGYSDQNLFVALNTQEKVVGENVTDCRRQNGRDVCSSFFQRASFAIPLEIIYLTPLSKWNPYDLEYKGDHWTKNGRTVIANGRNGGFQPNKAYNGTSSKYYYRTPAEFFTGQVIGRDPADTSRGTVGVLDPFGEVKRTRASGTHVFLPSIPGVGVVRQRYPIFPVHGEGSAVWKELEALKDAVMEMKRYRYLFREKPDFSGGPPPTSPPAPKNLILELKRSTSNGVQPHIHSVVLTPEEAARARHGQTVTVYSTEDSGHSHQVAVQRFKGNDNNHYWRYTKCDSQERCWDGHPAGLTWVAEA